MKNNQCYIAGRLGRDPDTGTTKKGLPYTRFSVASNHMTKNGEKEVDWVPVTVWGDLALAAAEKLGKGDWVIVFGKYTSGSYTGKDGIKRRSDGITADRISLPLFPKTPGGSQQSAGHDSSRGQGGFGQFGTARPDPEAKLVYEQPSFDDRPDDPAPSYTRDDDIPF